MSQPLVAVGSFSVLGGIAALGSGIVSGASLWPGVALFCLAGLLACAAAAIEAAAESAKREAELDVTEEIEAAKRIAIGEAVCALAPRFDAIDAKIDHLQKKDALNALG